MASRSGGGMGVTVALVISILLVLTLILTNMLFYTKKDQAEQELAGIESQFRAIVRTSELERDDVKQLTNEAGSESVLMHLQNEFRSVMQLVSGNRDMDRGGLESIMNAEGLEDTTLLAAYREQRTRANATSERAQSLEEQLDIAESRLADFSEERERMRADHQATIDSLNEQIEAIQRRADRYAREVEQAKQDMERRVASIRDNYEQQIADLESELEDAKNELASKTDSIQTLQSKLNEIRVSASDEGAIQDGEVLEILDDGSVFIDLGRQDRVVLGMRFEVYGDITETRRDASGNIPPGKATIEVTRIDETTSRARAIRTTRGRAPVRGDILVNPIYDRNKTYSFFVFGDFDLDGVGGPTARETETVRSRIREWGGEIADEFRGDIDFLVVGVAPEEPGPLPPSPTGPQVRRHVEAQRFYSEYQDLINRAGNLSIPVLNQNRLFTLIGYYGP